MTEWTAEEEWKLLNHFSDDQLMEIAVNKKITMSSVIYKCIEVKKMPEDELRARVIAERKLTNSQKG